jgi:hypothetical protein
LFYLEGRICSPIPTESVKERIESMNYVNDAVLM